ncbi:protein-tyrosine phosphatase 1 [Cavenderia fasciculata]|uniref:protein-tyrosine-phosphatase n=1 Tax=Cavenderia fasciculata TaxID=261658 RepID=F4Q320_CACFS|nr:protein-tyrosine phosphatase 1 [Cavenderia fasciculata]EGG17584.1 protein-tyrosine phosphatase 1 [Cavenderia fasciculata]|eukprot:XP_004356068.1 protein-tyrosine phosphatase 1 [Cavenderia fasciculata]
MDSMNSRSRLVSSSSDQTEFTSSTSSTTTTNTGAIDSPSLSSSSSSTSSSTSTSPLSNGKPHAPSRSSSQISLSSSQPSLNRGISMGAIPTTRSTADMPPPPLPPNHERLLLPIADLRLHTEQRMKEEFMTLESIYHNSIHVTIEGTQKYNTSKNRYTNILPCDLTRVKLEKVNGQEGSDYINANFIDGEYDRQYICTQGPLQNTIADFWRMVWENESYIIVMLSKELENCRPKCDRYWSETDPVNFEKFCVKLKEIVRDEEREIITRTFILTNATNNESRIITHYQYEGWPDHNAPNDTEPLRCLLHLINQNQNDLPEKDQANPIVVHCSAGVGRTGTFCTVHIMMSRIDNSPLDKVDFNLYSVVNNLRKQRPGMVQQLEQYLFCYEAIEDELRERNIT